MTDLCSPRSSHRLKASGVHVPADDPLHHGAWEHDDAVGELQGEAVGQLVVKASCRQRETDNFVDVGILRVEVLRNVHALREVWSDVRHESIHERFPEEAATAKSRVEGADDCLDVRGNDDGDDFHRGSDDGRHPVVQVLSKKHGQHRSKDLHAWKLQLISNSQCNSHRLRKLRLQRGNDRHPCREEVLRRLHQTLGLLDGHHGHLCLVVDQVICAHLLHIRNAILVLILLVVNIVGLFHSKSLLIAEIQFIHQDLATEVAEGFVSGNGSKIHTSKETQADSKDHLNQVDRQNLVDLVQLLRDEDVDHGNDDQWFHEVSHEAFQSLLVPGVILRVQGHGELGGAHLFPSLANLFTHVCGELLGVVFDVGRSVLGLLHVHLHAELHFFLLFQKFFLCFCRRRHGVSLSPLPKRFDKRLSRTA
mmetsp:Transcript_55212/g.103505  ORF Transcript_55212/g.103505 Transcript_55212/m.103505 type:complete len:421 (+) Transcript_55212:110-1372(+)